MPEVVPSRRRSSSAACTAVRRVQVFIKKTFCSFSEQPNTKPRIVYFRRGMTWVGEQLLKLQKQGLRQPGFVADNPCFCE